LAEYCENSYFTESNLYIQCNSHQTLHVPLHRNRKESILKFIWKYKRPTIDKTILNKKSNAREVSISDFKLYYRAIKKHGTGTKADTQNQWNRAEDLEINPYSYSHLIFDIGAQNMWGKRQPLQQMVLRKLVIYMQKN
jgi:hypothetical protein